MKKIFKTDQDLTQMLELEEKGFKDFKQLLYCMFKILEIWGI